MPGFQVNPFSK